MREIVEQVVAAVRFLRPRSDAPRACVIDKPHLQEFLCQALEELGFVTSIGQRDASTMRRDSQVDVYVLGLSIDFVEAVDFLEALSSSRYVGHVLIVGAPASPMTTAVQRFGVECELNMLPPLITPFNDETLRRSLAELLPHV